MKKVIAIVYGEYGTPADVLRTEEQELAAPGEGQALVEMRAAPINPADVLNLEGRYGAEPPAQEPPERLVAANLLTRHHISHGGISMSAHAVVKRLLRYDRSVQRQPVSVSDHPADRLVRRDTLIGVFWPESTEGRARNSLNQMVYSLRRSLGGDVVVMFDGQPVPTIDDLHRLLTDLQIGRRVPMTVLRRGRRMDLSIVPAETRH